MFVLFLVWVKKRSNMFNPANGTRAIVWRGIYATIQPVLRTDPKQMARARGVILLGLLVKERWLIKKKSLWFLILINVNALQFYFPLSAVQLTLSFSFSSLLFINMMIISPSSTLTLIKMRNHKDFFLINHLSLTSNPRSITPRALAICFGSVLSTGWIVA